MRVESLSRWAAAAADAIREVMNVVQGMWERIVRLSRSRRAGYTLLAVCGTSFAILAYLAFSHETVLLRVDGPINEEVAEARTGLLTRIMVWVSLFGTRWVIGALLAAMAIWVMATGRCRRTLLVLVAAFALDFVLEVVLKQGIGRARPDLLRIARGRGPSFPSGHVLAAVGFYGVLAVVAWKSAVRSWVKLGAYGAAAAIILAMGFSRMYLGVHWFTDVVGGYLVGAMFVLAVTRAIGEHSLRRPQLCCA